MLLLWPGGIALTGWDYLWRTTPMHRREVEGSSDVDGPPPLPAGTEDERIQPSEVGFGPFYHRIFETRIREAAISAEELMGRLMGNLDAATPPGLARFEKTRGAEGRMEVGDEFVVRVPGPWNGPVRVVAVEPRSFRLATLEGHFEAGQIEFRCTPEDDLLHFRIETWVRSGNGLSNVLYSHLGMSKETQLHMWISFLERTVSLSGGRMTGGMDVETRRVDAGPGTGPESDGRDTAADGVDERRVREVMGPPRIQRRLARLERRKLNFDPDGADGYGPSTGWRRDDFHQDLPAEAPGPPLEHGSFAVAQRLMRGYQFADPSIVHAYYDPRGPLLGRTMLLSVRFHGLRFHAGTRVVEEYERTLEDDEGRPVHLWGWGYGTLEGHFEKGRMDWQLWKWTDTGEVQFRIHAYSRRAAGRNPIIRLGFRLFGRREQLAFLRSTLQRMEALTTLGVREDAGSGDVHEAAEELTARGGDTRHAHDELVRNLERTPASSD
jgi:uncharacterized protein (UPF0548 family)